MNKYVELKRSLSEIEHARAIFELVIAQPTLNMLELLVKVYIDFEISGGEYERIRQLYKRLLDQIKYLKVWISYAKFEASTDMEDEEVDRKAPNKVFLYKNMICFIQYYIVQNNTLI